MLRRSPQDMDGCALHEEKTKSENLSPAPKSNSDSAAGDYISNVGDNAMTELPGHLN